MYETCNVVVAIPDARRAQLQSDVEKILRRLDEPALSSGEWQELFDQYSQLYFERLLWTLVNKSRPSCQQPHVTGTMYLTDNVRNDIDAVLALINEAPLTAGEWWRLCLPSFYGHRYFVNDIVGTIRRNIKKITDRERLQDERFIES